MDIDGFLEEGIFNEVLRLGAGYGSFAEDLALRSRMVICVLQKMLGRRGMLDCEGIVTSIVSHLS